MRRILAVCSLYGVGFICQSQMMIAQEKMSGSPVSVTGCLAQGDERNEYSIRDSSGKTFGLVHSKVNLKPHIGHQVTVTGTPVNEGEKHEKSGKAEESEHLQVTELKMVAPSCQ
jgi:hypothetical protein